MLPSTVMELSTTVWIIAILAIALLMVLVFHARRQSRLHRAMDAQYWSKVKERKLRREAKRRTDAVGKTTGNSQDEELLGRLQKKEEHVNVFIDSIDPNVACSLASRHRGSKPCRLFQKAANGSYNVCYFVELPDDGTRWVVEIPLVPTVRNVWDKVQSEVATCGKYIKKHTAIPIPRVQVFGRAGPVDGHNPTGLAYVILDNVPGRSLDLASSLAESRQSRSGFYSQLIDVLAELPHSLAESWPRRWGAFVLAYPDLRWSNIIVDEDLTIRGIIDWEWASTIPRSSMAGSATSSPPRRRHPGHAASMLGPRLPKQVAFPMAVVLRHNSHFLALYYKAIFPHFYKGPLKEALAQFFAADGDDGPISVDVQQRLANSRRYTPYLQSSACHQASHQTPFTKSSRSRVSLLSSSNSPSASVIASRMLASISSSLVADSSMPIISPCPLRVDDREALLDVMSFMSYGTVLMRSVMDSIWARFELI
ncbi:hypothetical protein CONLIGDRAFT_719350 [Coniochaeta ligniaria NRRL 30616]|uniref:Aminoglycoside phosphotransferase domain-containing protein n=1 Tax=Coniochaeta ligniaria NRRL 30616 TaxID=1408157 RepID=A0A1J7I6H9_9PEZI|nr:hypothetical protein CONLIGDRAFT_719350 [Coniochaeta ligniaria NRRL 30616]